MSKSDDLEALFLNHALGFTATSWTRPTTMYASIASADVNDTGAQNTNEHVYSGYARHNIGVDTANWTITSNVASNDSAWSFGANGSGGSITVEAVMVGPSATLAGTLYWYDSSMSVSYADTQEPTIAAGGFTITET